MGLNFLSRYGSEGKFLVPVFESHSLLLGTVKPGQVPESVIICHPGLALHHFGVCNVN